MKFYKLLIITLTLILIPITAANGQFTINNPSVSKIKEAADYATDTFEDSWDMSNADDLWPNYSNMANTSFSSGTFSATATTNDPVLYFLWGGYPGSVAAPRDGVKKSIDTSKYKNVSIKMYSSVDGGIAQLYWFYNQDITIDRESVNFHVYKGWHIYNLSTHKDTDGTWSQKWTGKPIGMRLDPINSSGANFSIDWLKISAVDADSKIDLSWFDNEDDELPYQVYAAVDGNDVNGALLGTANASSRDLKVDLSSMLAGDYQIYLVKSLLSSESKSGNNALFNINSSPTVIITEPDLAGGKDWATNILGNPWDMSNSSDLSGTHSVTSKTFQNGYFTGVNQSVSGSAIDDPFVYLNQKGKKINADKYHRLSIRYKYDGPFDLVRGTMARVGWRNYPNNKGWQHTDDILTYSGWTTLTYDLKNVALDVGNYGWRDYISDFRFDPHEDYLGRRFYIDSIRLNEDDAALNGRFDIKYNVSDSNDSGTSLALKADPDLNPLNGNETVISTMTAGNGEGVFTWIPNTTFNGTYNILADVNDGVNSQYSYSSGPVIVDTFRPQVFTKKSKAFRKSNVKKEIIYFKLLKSAEKKIRKARNASERKRIVKIINKYKKAYLNAKKKIAKAQMLWYVHDLYGDNAAAVTITIKKKVETRSSSAKTMKLKKLVIRYKKILGKAKSSIAIRKYRKLISASRSKISKLKAYVYRPVKIIKYKSTSINKWKKYYWKTSSAGLYVYYVSAVDSAGNIQEKVSGSSLVVK